jgi:hypothetical protein
MYYRKIDLCPEKIVSHGKAHFGNFNDVSKKISISGMRAPYAGIPLPAFISKLRIKSKIDFVFNLDSFIGFTRFFDLKLIGLAEIILWDKESGKRYSYHSFMPPRRRFDPKTTNRRICASYNKARYIKISWGREHQHHALSFKVLGDSVRPNAEGFCYSPMQDFMHKDMMFVNPSPSTSRCVATWFSSMSLNGSVSVGSKGHILKQDNSNGLGIMTLKRAYYKFRTKTKSVYGIGKIKDKNVVFYIQTSNLDAADTDAYNSNVLVVDGVETVLPPVYITHPFGIDKKWIIQDTESMIDLAFNPISTTTRTLNILLLKNTASIIYGTFEGTLLTKDGEKIVLKNLTGILHTDNLRL